MSYYTDKDISLFESNSKKIKAEVEYQQIEKGIIPSKKEEQFIYGIIIDYIIANKRKVYGGYALNLLLSKYHPKDMIYNSDDTPDIDFYSPSPLEDLKAICDKLHSSGIKFVSGREAQHGETYSVFANLSKTPYCDITYVPNIVYNATPFDDVDGIRAVTFFQHIDKYQMFTDPMCSYWRLYDDKFCGVAKELRRYDLLLKVVPFPKYDNKINITGDDPNIENVLDSIYKFMQNRKTIIVTGYHAYNHFIDASKVELSSRLRYIKKIHEPHYEFISSDYRTDALELIELLKSKYKNITHVEFYPYFQFIGHSVEIYYDEELVARIYWSRTRAYPYLDFKSKYYGKNDIDVSKKTFTRIASFQLTILLTMVSRMRARSNRNNDEENLQLTILSHLIDMRKYYFDKNKDVTFLDDTPFKDFVTNTIGDTMLPEKMLKLKRDSLAKRGKVIIYKYEPEKSPVMGIYRFANTSGNPIRIPKYLKLSSKAYNSDNSTEEEDEADDPPKENIEKDK